MSFAIAELDALVDKTYAADVKSRYNNHGYYDDTDATEVDVWCIFYKELHNTEALELPGIGYAYLADSDVDGKDYWNEGDIWFVFKVTVAGEPDRFFRRRGYYSSYEGRQFDGGTTEVSGRMIIQQVWENAA